MIQREIHALVVTLHIKHAEANIPECDITAPPPVKVEFVDLRSCDKSIRRANRQTESV